LKEEHLVKVLVQRKHRYYDLVGPDVAKALEGLSVRKRLVSASKSAAGARSNRARVCESAPERAGLIGGALGAAILRLALKEKWVTRELDSRALYVTSSGRRELKSRFRLNA
jgi:hypothetical protein